MLQWIEHQGKKILRMDVDGMDIGAYVKEVYAGRDAVLASNPAPNSVLLLVVGEQPKGALDEAKESWKVFQEATKGLMKAQAVVGLSGFKRVVARLVLRDLYFAASEEDAKDWLVRQ
ncbi:MAG: hypothetical protein ACOX6T_22990 [Myxococcales bacterium]|jgi:hypothetical protein